MINCPEINNCEKIKKAMYKDILDYQAVAVIYQTCNNCDKSKSIIMCSSSGQGEICPGNICPKFYKCFVE